MRGTNESNGNKIKDFDSSDIMFLIYSNKQNALVRLTRSLPLRPNGRIFLVLMRYFSFSCGNPARPRPGENTVYIKVKLFIYNFFNGILVHNGKQNTHSPSGFEELIQFHEVFGSIARIEQETCHSSAITCSLFFFFFLFCFVFFHHGNTYFQLSALRKLFSLSILFPLY